MAVDQPVASERAAPRTFDGAALLSGATLASGVFAYAYHVLAARTLGPEAYGLVAVLWAALFLLVVVLFRPLEQTTSRALADRLARGHEVRSVLRAMFRIYLVVAVAVGVAGVARLEPDRRTSSSSATASSSAALLVGLAAYGVAYVLRGVCAGVGWFNGLRAAARRRRRGAARGRRCRSSSSPRAISLRRRWSPRRSRASLLPVLIGRRVLDAARPPRARDSRSTSAPRSRSPGRRP